MLGERLLADCDALAVFDIANTEAAAMGTRIMVRIRRRIMSASFARVDYRGVGSVLTGTLSASLTALSSG
jgi:hypothetical protein